MSAVVTVPRPVGSYFDDVNVPKANGYSIDSDTGYLHLKTANWGEQIAVFKQWERVIIITPDRGANGRFIKKD